MARIDVSNEIFTIDRFNRDQEMTWQLKYPHFPYFAVVLNPKAVT